MWIIVKYPSSGGKLKDGFRVRKKLITVLKILINLFLHHTMEMHRITIIPNKYCERSVTIVLVISLAIDRLCLQTQLLWPINRIAEKMHSHSTFAVTSNTSLSYLYVLTRIKSSSIYSALFSLVIIASNILQLPPPDDYENANCQSASQLLN